MAVQRTLSIIKPDATGRGITGRVNAHLEGAELNIVAQKRVRISISQARAFYAEHAERAFYDDLCTYMASAPIVVQVLEGEDAIARRREVMGATNPANAEDGTIRKEFGLDVQENSVHGSDSLASAAREICFFFGEIEIIG